jgi:hypothetical protein
MIEIHHRRSVKDQRRRVVVQIVAVMLGLIGGVVAWFGANFYGKSLVLFFELRALTHEEMMFSADLTSMLDPVQYNASSERLRRLASRLKSLAETTPRPVRRLWLASGYNPGAAADLLMRYAYSFDPVERRRLRPDVEKALRFALWPEPVDVTVVVPVEDRA